MKKRIVAEVTRNWDGTENNAIKSTLLSQRFEHVIATNAERGYALESWRFNTVWGAKDANTTPLITETIIAVFVEV